MDLQHACAAVLDEVDGSLCCIVIDTQTGLTVAAEYRTGSVMDAGTINLVSVIGTNMFRGKLISQFRRSLATERASAAFVREVQMTTANTNHFMAAIPSWNEGIFVLVTDKSVSLGLGWMAVHRIVGQLGEAPAPNEADAAVNQGWVPPQQAPAPYAGQMPPASAGIAPAHQPLSPPSPAAAAMPPPQSDFQAPPPTPEPYGGSVHSIPSATVGSPEVGSPENAGQPTPQAAAADAGQAQVAQQVAAQNANAGAALGAESMEAPDRQAPARAGKRTRSEATEREAVPMGPRMNFMSRKRKK